MRPPTHSIALEHGMIMVLDRSVSGSAYLHLWIEHLLYL